ncbi:MAG: adenylate/guanylate cyclase domain-containing protein, partial [Myxococcales bacterium]
MKEVHEAELAELKERWALNQLADDVLEQCMRDELSMKRTMDRFLAEVGRRLGAKGGAVLTRDEELNQAAYAWGDLGDEDAWTLLSGREAGVHAVGDALLACQPLDVAGMVVGHAGFVFDKGAPASEILAGRLHAVCEELDAILATVQAAARKQELILGINHALSNRVFERGLDEAVEVLHRGVRFRECVVVWRDVVADGALTYRFYVNGRLAFSTEGRTHPGMEAAIAAHGLELLTPERNRLRAALGLNGSIESVLMSGLHGSDWLGKVLVRGDDTGFSPTATDLVRVLAQMARDRLVDHNREKRHLAQFFSAQVINELLREPAYQQKFLAPREERIAIVYADINGFTRITEQILEQPALIGEFVDRWGDGAVDILWRNGGTFDAPATVVVFFAPENPAAAPAVDALQALVA